MNCNLDSLNSSICNKLVKCMKTDEKIDHPKIEEGEDSNMFVFILILFFLGAILIFAFKSPDHGERLINKLIRIAT